MNELMLVQTQGSPDHVFRAIARCVPVAGGLVGALGDGNPSSPVSHVVALPPPVIESWASTPRDQLAQMLAPMLVARPGELVSDSQAIVGHLREELDLLRRLDAAGLGESAGYKVATRRTPRGGAAHHFLTFALDRGERFGERHRRSLALLQPAIVAALDRLRVPLVASEPLLAQVVDEQSIGYMCLARGGRIVELNQRMHALATRYFPAAHVEPGRGAFARFADRARLETQGGRSWHLRHEDGRSLGEISGHEIAKESHSIGEDLLLVVMKEFIFAPASPGAGVLRALTSRQREVARLLVESGLSYKQIADRLGIRDGTVRKHVERIYKAARVHGRPELVIKLR
jgi:DNA-binding CsgD family transcriptional regulator